jgi:Tfp pilus assembly protein PilW
VFTDDLKRTWRSPVYSFFKEDVAIQTHDGRPVHFFKCASRHCKTKAGGVRRFQDSKDRASTANLRHHAVKCFGAEAVANVTKPDTTVPNGSIFALFGRQGQKPVHYSHRSHTNAEVRYVYSVHKVGRYLSSASSARLVKWVTESNRPASIINDRELEELMTAGRPHIKLPSRYTLSRDIEACFKKCRVRIATLLKV